MCHSAFEENGGEGRIRTFNLLRMKELHYQLCYLAYSRLLWLYRFLGKKVTDNCCISLIGRHGEVPVSLQGLSTAKHDSLKIMFRTDGLPVKATAKSSAWFLERLSRTF